MVKTTKAQRHAIKAIMEQDHQSRMERVRHGTATTLWPYKWYRRAIEPTFGMDGAVVMPIWGMFIAIEADGYRHS